MQRKERGTRGCACNCTVRCIEDDAVGACAARPMHVVSTSMSRRDLNFPTLSAPYRTPCPLPRALARTLPPPLLHVYSMQLSSCSAPQPPELAMRRDVARCSARALRLPARERVPVVVTTNTHVRVPRRACRPRARSYARATAHDFSPMRPDPFPRRLPLLLLLAQCHYAGIVCEPAFFWERKNKESRGPAVSRELARSHILRYPPPLPPS